MTTFEAIKEMRELTRQGKSFSFTFLSFSRDSGQSQGIIEVQNARLLQREKEKYNQYTQHQERYLNIDTNEPRRFWHPLLLSFNGQSLTPA